MKTLVRDKVVAVGSRYVTPGFLIDLRWELLLILRSAQAALSPRQRRLRARLAREGSDLKVHLGSGPWPVPGWVNLDGAFKTADLIQKFNRPLKLPSGSAAMAFSEHVLEHLEYPEQAQTFLAEVYRVLQHGGHFRVIVPDGEKAIRAYAEGDDETLRRLSLVELQGIEAVNKIFREWTTHKFAWDYSCLSRELSRVGFVETRRAAFRDSAVPELNLDLDEEPRKFQSLYVETRKPLDPPTGDEPAARPIASSAYHRQI